MCVLHNAELIKLACTPALLVRGQMKAGCEGLGTRLEYFSHRLITSFLVTGLENLQ